GDERRVVEADHGDVARDAEPALAAGADRAERHQVAGADDAGAAAVEELRGGGLAAFDGEQRVADELAGVDAGQPAHGLPVALDLADHGDEAPGPEGQADAFVVEVGQVSDGEAGGHAVVGGDEGGVDVLVVAVDEHDGQAAVG